MSHTTPPPRHPPWLHRSKQIPCIVNVALITVAGALFAFPAASSAATGATGSTAGFVENRGQLDGPVLYTAPGTHAPVFFTAGAVVLDLHGAAANAPRGTAPPGGAAPLPAGAAATRASAVWVHFADANPAPRVEARERLGARYNFFLGNDPAAWRTGVPAFAEIVYHDLWPGIDLVFRREDGELRYEVHAGAGADPEQVRFRYDGADSVTPGISGVDRIDTAAGVLLHRRARAGGRAGAFGHAAGEGATAGGGPGRNDPARLLWSTFLGGDDREQARGVCTDASDNVVVAGTAGIHFPTTPGSYDPTANGGADAFVCKLNAAGNTLLWGTYLGGSLDDYLFGLDLDSEGNATIAGNTNSQDFPHNWGTPTIGGDGFVARISASGNALIWSMIMGGNNGDTFHAVALDAAGDALVTGRTWSNDFPTSFGAYDPGPPTHPLGVTEAMVVKLIGATGGLAWSTYLGGTDDDAGYAIAVDSSKNPVVTGFTRSWDFPTTPGAYDTQWNGEDAFVTKLNPSGTNLVWSTFLGGGHDTWNERGLGIALDDSMRVLVGGVTDGDDFPTTPGAFDRTYNGGLTDGFVSKLDASGSSLLWSTYMGGAGRDSVNAVTFDPWGLPQVAGTTSSDETTFPITIDTYDGTFNGVHDAFVTILFTGGGGLNFSSYLGGAGVDQGWAVASDLSGNPVLAGYTDSSNYPTTAGAYDPTYNTYGDVFVSKLRGLSSVVLAHLEWYPHTLLWQLAVPFGCNQLTLVNSGDSDLHWDASEAHAGSLRVRDGRVLEVNLLPASGAPAAAAAARTQRRQLPHLELPKGVTDPRGSAGGAAAARGSGGPDAFGYQWTDSDEPGGPVFEWYDIAQVGETVTLGDDDSAVIDLPFAFPFYGITHTSVAIGSNGYLTFGPDGAVYQNQPLPDPAVPNDLIAPFWDDLDPSAGGIIHFYNDAANERVFVQYTDVPGYGGTGAYTFQVILHRNGTILYQYLVMEGELESATTGIENPGGDVGLEVAFSAPYVHDGLAVRIEDALPWLTEDPPGGVIAPGEHQDVACCVDASGLEPGSYAGDLIIHSNDPEQPEVTVPLLLVIPEPVPDIAVEPGALAFETTAGGVACDAASIANLGGVGLDWALSEIEGDAGLRLRDGRVLPVELAASGGGVPAHLDLPKGATDQRAGAGAPGARGAGGPDAFGYHWLDSDEPGGPAFDWVDITGSGTPVSLGDDDFTEVELPWVFPFYGERYGAIKICSNGYLTFGPAGTVFLNQPIPDPTEPNALIAPFWDDLDPSAGGRIDYLRDFDAGRFIVQYTDVPHFDAPGTCTFEMILRHDGGIVFQYENMQGELGSATVGIEAHEGWTGLEVVFNAPYVHDGLAVLCEDPFPWLSGSPSGGIVPPFDFATLDVCVDAAGLEPGGYAGGLVIRSNDPDHPQVVLPVALSVLGTTGVGDDDPAMAAPPLAFKLYRSVPNPFRRATAIRYELPEPAQASVRIYDVAGRLVRVLVDGAATTGAGRHQVAWDGRNDAGRRLASGVYFFRLQAGPRTTAGRLILLR